MYITPILSKEFVDYCRQCPFHTVKNGTDNTLEICSKLNLIMWSDHANNKYPEGHQILHGETDCPMYLEYVVVKENTLPE